MRRLLLTIVVIALILLAFLAGMGLNIFAPWENFITSDRVAVLKVEGVISDSAPFLESLASIKKDASVKALVLRIDSPGGSVGPSQEIYQEVKKLKIPVVASMGTIGASGGYYIACSAQKIYANPGTITGSIGVIMEFLNYRELMNWAKVGVEVVKSGEFKDVGSPFRDMTEAERAFFQALIDNAYGQFKRVVSQSRKIDMKELDTIADGRVYTGEQAKNLKLIDELGTINDAVNTAAKLGGIEGEDPETVYYPRIKEGLINLLFSSAKSYIPTNFLAKERFGLFYLVDIIK